MNNNSDVLNGPMSNCTCGHTGDLRLGAKRASQHAGPVGHGACVVQGCPCSRFTWSEFLPGVAEARKTEMKRLTAS